MKRFFPLILVLFAVSLFAKNPTVTRVTTHKRATVVTDPSKGANPYPSWGVFPPTNVPVRKITMHVTLGSPDSLGTAHWDYLDHIYLRKQGGVNGKSVDYEIGRMLTPYGSVFGKGWQWKWQVDVTDFAPLLRDSVQIEYVHSGWETTTVGWALTVDFEVVHGDPAANSLGVTPLWNKGYKYGDPNEKIEDNLLPITYQTPHGTAFDRIRIQHTGHGMDKPKGCSEFCSRWREISIDNQLVDRRDMWKDCGSNPLYPQGGTWLYDRAYWCPGDLQEPDVLDVPVKPGQHEVSLRMEPYTATENIQAVENIAAYLFHYSKPLKKNDVAVDKVPVPNNEKRFSRLNPAAFHPRFTIRNLGSENLRSVVVTYGTEGFPQKTYRWTGDLKFNQTAEIILREEIQMKEGKNNFTVSLSKPNGKTDGWNGDNELTTTFFAPVKLPTEFVVQFKTNNRPADNEVTIYGLNFEPLYKIKPLETETNKLFTDTVRLKEGLYEISLTDSAGDGLEFWAEPQNGDGFLRLFDLQGNLLHEFESDCGNGEKLAFSASKTFVNDTTRGKYAFSLYPRMVTRDAEFSIVSNREGTLTVQIMVDGKVWEKHEYENVKNGTYTYNLSNLPAGRIVLEALVDGVTRFKGRLNKRAK